MSLIQDIINKKRLKPVLIAEIGINHNGNLNLAKRMIKSAKKNGADIVKFQTHIVDKEMLPDRKTSSKASHVKGSLYKILSDCSFSFKQQMGLKNFCKDQGVEFLSTPFSVEAVDLLEKLKVSCYKTGSGETNNYNFLKYVLKKNKPVIISTGTSSWLDLIKLEKVIKTYKKNIIMMQCTSNYPTEYKDSNVNVIKKIKKELNMIPGFSDHSQGNYASFAAVALGAKVIERHYTLSRSLPGIDQKASLEPHEFKELSEGINSIFESLGDKKLPNKESIKVVKGFSQSIVSIANIEKGDKLRKGINIWYKRPGTGIPSNELIKVHGKKAKKKIKKDTLLLRSDF